MAMLRTLLFVPGDNEHKLGGAAVRGADAVVIDLEDAVAASQKDTALACAAAALLVEPALVRINPPDVGRLELELEALVPTRVAGLIVPKVESIDEMRLVGARLDRLERRTGVDRPPILLFPIIETARGVTHSDEIAAVGGRVAGTIFGSVDFARDIGMNQDAGELDLLYARSRVLMSSRAAGLTQIIDGPFTALDDLSGLLVDSLRSRRSGFTGRVVLHPAQISVANNAYSESDADSLSELVAAFEAAELKGQAAIRHDGVFVDYASYRAAKAQLDEVQGRLPA